MNNFVVITQQVTPQVAKALILKFNIFLKDLKRKTVSQNDGNVSFVLGPFKSADKANQIIVILSSSKFGLKSQLKIKPGIVKTYYLFTEKFATRQDAENELEMLKTLGIKAKISGL